MKNKKGFTLVEITISVALLSLIMVFMLSFLTEVRKNEDTINTETDMLLNKSLISKTLNESINNEDGIESVTCENDSCSIKLNTGNEKNLYLENDNKVIVYKDVTNNQIELKRSSKGDYRYNINLTETENLIVIDIYVISHEEYNISVVYYKSN